MIVHHGMFWGGLQPLRGMAYKRVRALIEHDIAVYAAHLPLDRHAIHGNNVLLARALNLTPSGEFARYKTISVGVRGNTELRTSELYARAVAFARSHGGNAVATPATDNRITRAWAICTGGDGPKPDRADQSFSFHRHKRQTGGSHAALAQSFR